MDIKHKKKYCICVDGSVYSEYGFDLVFDELYEKGDNIVVTHVYNNEKLSEIPFDNQPKSIQSKYETKLIGKLVQTDFEIIIKDKGNSNEHSIEIVNGLAKNRNCTMLVMGFHGHKGEKEKKEVSKGIIYLIKQIKLPTFIIKERSQRKSKESGGFLWLVFIEKSNTRSFYAFEFALNYINKDLDKIMGINIVDGYKDTVIELQFNSICKKVGIKNISFQYLPIQRDLKVTGMICEMVNFGKDYVDFLVLGHNPSKTKVEESPCLEVMKNSKTNILFYT